MIIRDLLNYFQSLAGDWSYPAETVDTLKSGQQDWEIGGIAVSWMSFTSALQKAFDLGCNVFITHEPTFYDHYDMDPSILAIPSVRAKRDWIEQHRMAVYRCHDLWDRLPHIGIVDTWGEFLGFSNPVASDDYVRVYQIDPQPALTLARMVATRLQTLNQPGVQLIGPSTVPVRSVCIGTGAITPFIQSLERFQIDIAICTDDGINYWRDGAYAIDMHIPLIVVNHPVSEEAGVKRLAETLMTSFPQVPVFHIPQRCMYQLVKGE